MPCPGSTTVIYGGNTSCIEIRADDRLIIVDLGTGVRPLGEWLMDNDFKKKGKIDADIFLTHTHWDHIMGFPIFAPVYMKGSCLRITAPVSIESENIEAVIKKQLSYSYWPVNAHELAANIEFNQIGETTLDLGDGLTVISKHLNHPVLCLGYRFNYQGRSLVTVFDHEPFHNLYQGDSGKEAEEGEAAAREENEKIIRFMEGADVLIHDAQYSQNEYFQHLGWGHASCEHAIDSAVKANVRKLVLFHHDPEHTDRQLKQLEKSYAKKSPVKLIMAKEGMTLQV